MDYTKSTLGELLTHPNETIKRNALSILKTLQKDIKKEIAQDHCWHRRFVMGRCVDCNIEQSKII